MVARVCTVPDYTNNKHVVVHVILPVEFLGSLCG
jgi:hypothetical protein